MQLKEVLSIDNVPDPMVTVLAFTVPLTRWRTEVAVVNAMFWSVMLVVGIKVTFEDVEILMLLRVAWDLNWTFPVKVIALVVCMLKVPPVIETLESVKVEGLITTEADEETSTVSKVELDPADPVIPPLTIITFILLPVEEKLRVVVEPTVKVPSIETPLLTKLGEGSWICNILLPDMEL